MPYLVRFSVNMRLSSLLIFAAVLNAHVSITPSKPASVPAGGVLQFKANVPVSWSLIPGSAGRIDPDGTYHAPSSIHVKHSVAGCQILSNDHVLNTRIDALPVDEHSATWMALIPPSRVNFFPDWGINIADASTPRKQMHFYYTPQNDGPFQMVPWPYLKQQSGVFSDPRSEVDRHTVTIDRDTCEVSELYNPYPPGNNARCGSCTAQGGNRYLSTTPILPSGATDAASLGLVPLTVGLEEIQSGSIEHALRVTFKNGIIARRFVWPAHSNAGAWGQIPYGTRFRLKASFDTSKFSKVARVLLTQLKEYGLIIADGGGNWDVSAYTDVTEDNSVMAAFGEISKNGPKSSDFEIVDESALMTSPDLGTLKIDNGQVAPDGYAVVIAKSVNDERDSARVGVTLEGVTVGISDPTAWIQSGVDVQLRAWVKGTTDKGVRWSMQPALGTLTPEGHYTSPEVERPTYTVLTAASAADPKAQATLGLTVLPKGPIRIKIGNATAAPGAPNRLAPDYGPDSKGNMWWRDQAGEVSWGVINDDYSSDWPKQPDIALFYTSRYSFGDMLYRFWVPDGKYKITLLFGQNGQDHEKTYPKNYRAPIHLEAQGQIVVKNYDMGAGIGYARRTPVWQSIPGLVTNKSLYFVLRRVTVPGDARPSPLLNGFVVEADPTPAHLAVDPAKVDEVKINEKIQFAAVGWYMANTATWSILKGPGSISAEGLYSAPAEPPKTDEEVVVQAKSTADPSKVATANLTFKVGALAITPQTPSVLRGLTDQFTATIDGAKYDNVSWSIQPTIGNIAEDGTYTAPDNLSKDEQITVKAASRGEPVRSATAVINVKARPDPIRINCGSTGAFKDAHGNVWAADYGFSPGTITWSLNVPIPNTTPDMYPLYHSSRYKYANDSFNYTFALPDGHYRVVLKFSDYVFDVAGKHVFDVKINGQEVLKNFDPNAVGPAKAAVDRSFETTVQKKSLRIDFIGHAGGALINGMEIDYIGDL